MRLSILICSIRSRRDLLGRLLAILEPQAVAQKNVELLIDADDGELTIGEKRNRLLERSVGTHVCFIDDDDTVADDYVARLVSALSTDPDCVGFRAKWYEDGRHTADTTYTIRNQKRREIPHGDRFLVERQPGHLTPIRREIALAVRFQPWNYGEDADFSIRVRPYLNTEVFVDHVLYHYWLRNRDARANEKTHPQRWQDDNFRIERSLKAALEARDKMKLETVPPDTDR